MANGKRTRPWRWTRRALLAEPPVIVDRLTGPAFAALAARETLLFFAGASAKNFPGLVRIERLRAGWKVVDPDHRRSLATQHAPAAGGESIWRKACDFRGSRSMERTPRLRRARLPMIQCPHRREVLRWHEQLLDDRAQSQANQN